MDKEKIHECLDYIKNCLIQFNDIPWKVRIKEILKTIDKIKAIIDKGVK